MRFETYAKRLSKHLRELRTKAELTQIHVASEAGITRQHLQRLEAGASNPKIETLFNLAKVYRVAIADIVKV